MGDELDFGLDIDATKVQAPETDIPADLDGDELDFSLDLEESTETPTSLDDAAATDGEELDFCPRPR